MRAILATSFLVAVASIATVKADPCGMIPPIYDGPGQPITRVGEQTTYVYFKDGIESFVIRPGFTGKVDEFGMLIPFPTPPALRKMPDQIFGHIAASIDPPEVVIDIRPVRLLKLAAAQQNFSNSLGYSRSLGVKQVRVLRKEAVGMYEVAVLEAGSAKALKRWIDDHGFRYPDGMDTVTNDYIKIGWCFVAVKTRVGQKHGADPKPGQRRVNTTLPAGSAFDGHVQAMGFRFKTDELVVPMRLSAFNEGKLRNIVYLLTDGPKRIRSIPEEYVVRQIPGSRMFKNVTEPLPLRIIHGTADDLLAWHRQGLPERRNPVPHNGAAKQLFAADMLAVKTNQLSLPEEEQEKELLRIGEHFGLRGVEIDKLNGIAFKQQTDKTVASALKDIETMTLTVVDGDFPREVLARKNLTFGEYTMPSQRNKQNSYDATLKGPAPRKTGSVIIGQLPPASQGVNATASSRGTNSSVIGIVDSIAIPLSLSLLGLCLFLSRCRVIRETE